MQNNYMDMGYSLLMLKLRKSVNVIGGILEDTNTDEQGNIHMYISIPEKITVDSISVDVNHRLCDLDMDKYKQYMKELILNNIPLPKSIANQLKPKIKIYTKVRDGVWTNEKAAEHIFLYVEEMKMLDNIDKGSEE